MIAAPPTRRIFTAAEYHRMAETGILTADDRVELINGEIITMSPIGTRHAACVKRLLALLTRKLGQQVIISVQDPIRLGNFSEPEPDVAVLRFRDDYYASALPTATDTFLVIEVSDTTLAYDRNVKLPLYAKAGIPEVWIVNLNENRIEAYWQPANGNYPQTQSVLPGQTIASAAFPALSLLVNDVLG